jgi:hypothetical protein
VQQIESEIRGLKGAYDAVSRLSNDKAAALFKGLSQHDRSAENRLSVLP